MENMEKPETETPQAAPRRRLRRIGRIAAWCGAVLVLSVVLGLAFVRTDAGLAWVLDSTIALLDRQGLFLRVEKSTGSLPETLTLEGVTLADTEGVFLQTKRLSLLWNPWRLLHGMLEVDDLALIDAEWTRLPILPVSHAPESSASDFSLPELFQAIPWVSRISLHTLTLENARLGAAISGTALRLNLNGNSSLSAAEGRARLDLVLEEADSALEKGTATLQLEAALNSAKHNLKLDARIAGHGNWGGAPLSIPGLPKPVNLSWKASLHGDSPLTDWQGVLALESFDREQALLAIRGSVGLALAEQLPTSWKSVVEIKTVAANADILQTQNSNATKASKNATLTSDSNSSNKTASPHPELESDFACVTSGLSAEFPPPFIQSDALGTKPSYHAFVRLDLHSEAGAAAPPLWRAVPLRLQTTLAGGERARNIFLRCNDLTLSSPAGDLRFANFEFMPESDGFLVQGLLSAHLQENALAQLGLLSAAAPLASTSACLNARVQLASLSGQQRLRLESRSNLYQLPFQPIIPIQLDLNATHTSTSVSLEAQLNALGAQLMAKGSADPDGRAYSLDFTAAYSEDGLLRWLTGLPFSGRLKAEASLQKKQARSGETTPEPRLTLALDAYDLRCGILPDALLGNHAQLTLDASSADPLTSGRAELTLKTPSLKARTQLSLADQRYTASLDAQLHDLAVLFPVASRSTSRSQSTSDPAPLSGALDLRLEAEAPQTTGLLPESATAQLSFTSPELKSVLGRWECAGALKARLDADTRLAGDFSVHAVARSSTEEPAPQATLQGGWQYSPETQRFQLSSVQFDGAEIQARADLDLGLAHPVPVLNGKVQAEVRQWNTLSRLLGIPLAGEPAQLSLSFKPVPAHGLTQSSLTAQLDLPRLQSGIDGRVRNLKSAVRIADIFGAPVVQASLATQSGALGLMRWKTADISANGALDALILKIASTGSSEASLDAELSVPASLLHLRELYFYDSQKKTGFSLREPAELSWGSASGLYISQLALDIVPKGHGQVKLNMTQNPLACALTLDRVPVRLLSLLTSHPVPAGDLSGSLSLQAATRTAPPQINCSLNARNVAFADDSFTPLSLALEAHSTSQPPMLALDARLGGIDADEAQATLRLPLQKNSLGLFVPHADAPLEGHLLWQGALAPLWRFVPLPDRRLTGTGRVQLNISGSLNQPHMQGRALLCAARFEDLVDGILLTNINAEAIYAPDGLLQIMLRAHDYRPRGQLSAPLPVQTAPAFGTLALDGSVNLSSLLPLADLSLPAPTQQLDLRILIDNLSPLQRDDLSIDLSGDLNITGKLAAPLVHGSILVEKGNLNLVSGFSSSVPLLDIVDKNQVEELHVVPQENPLFDIQITVPRRFFIRGRGLESEWKGALLVRGSLDSPALTGTLEPVRGRFELLGNPCNISKGKIEFTGETPPNPMLNLELSRETADITALVDIGGTARKPRMTLQSVPPLPQDEVMSYILFGKPTTALSRFEALQAANAVRNLAGIGGSIFDPVATVRKALGVDVLRIGTAATTKPKEDAPVLWGESAAQQNGNDASNEGAMTLEAGKYVMDNVYLGVEQNAESGAPGVRVEIELLPRLNLEGSSNSESSEVGISWKKDY